MNGKRHLASGWHVANLAQFYQGYASPLLDYLRVRTRTLEDAEDILVETFLAARQNEQIAREVPGGQLAWLRQVARKMMSLAQLPISRWTKASLECLSI